MIYDWQREGAIQAAEESKRRIKRSGDRWWNIYRQITGDVDYLDKDAGEAPKGATW